MKKLHFRRFFRPTITTRGGTTAGAPPHMEERFKSETCMGCCTLEIRKVLFYFTHACFFLNFLQGILLSLFPLLFFNHLFLGKHFNLAAARGKKIRPQSITEDSPLLPPSSSSTSPLFLLLLFSSSHSKFQPISPLFPATFFTLSFFLLLHSSLFSLFHSHHKIRAHHLPHQNSPQQHQRLQGLGLGARRSS